MPRAILGPAFAVRQLASAPWAAWHCSGHPHVYTLTGHYVANMRQVWCPHLWSKWHWSLSFQANMGPILVARAIRNAIRANRFARIIRNWNPYFYSASGRLAWITRIPDSREAPDSSESCESIRADHATKGPMICTPRCVKNAFFLSTCSSYRISMVCFMVSSFWKFSGTFWRFNVCWITEAHAHMVLDPTSVAATTPV